MRILLTGGGTGGHIFPNIAIAKALRKQRHTVLYVGYVLGPERKIARSRKIPFFGIVAGKLRRYFSLKTIFDIIFIPIGFIQSFFVILFFWPQVIFSKGGYVSFPVVLAGFILRRRIITHESDSIPGLTNRWIAKMANLVCVNYEGTERHFDGVKTVTTGIPLRSSLAFADKKKGYKLTKFNERIPIVLIMGGSQGALQLNELTRDSLEVLLPKCQVIHLAGPGKAEVIKVEKKYRARYLQFDFLDKDLKHIYKISDLVVSRAGANALAEIQYFQIPSLLLPLKSAANNHQEYNAVAAVELGYSELFTEEEITPEIFSYRIISLLKNKKKRELMKKNLAKNKHAKATEKIVNLILDEDRC